MAPGDGAFFRPDTGRCRHNHLNRETDNSRENDLVTGHERDGNLRRQLQALPSSAERCAMGTVMVAYHPPQPLRLNERVMSRDIAFPVNDADIGIFAAAHHRPRRHDVSVDQGFIAWADQLRRSERSQSYMSEPEPHRTRHSVHCAPRG